MTTEKLITQFAETHAPAMRPGANAMGRYDLQTLSQYLNVEPSEVVNLAEAGLLQAGEPWPGAPSLTFSTHHLSALRREIALQHAADTVELCQGKQPGEMLHVMELSWKKRSEKVVELSAKR
ncbi:MAG: hypothetical protein ACQKBW_08170 [Puniceicoccales bacterium]